MTPQQGAADAQGVIALSCGEPAGIGPEIAVKAWDNLRGACPFVWLGDPRALPKGTPWRTVKSPDEARDLAAFALPVLELPFAGAMTPGQADPRNAAGVIQAIKTGVELVQSGQAAALCTAPIHKKALIDGADFAYPGHTEFLAALGDRKRVVMMLASDRLRVVPATIHIALAEVPKALTPAVLRETIEITANGLTQQFGISQPRIAIAGLNPHAGEGGAMGNEELAWINGLLNTMQGEGFTLTGPHPADTLFHAAARARYDAAIAMYHDQALIPIKTLDFDQGVNVTLGLPFIRTSPDHGTAFDIAGQGIANPDSLIAALRMAQTMAKSSQTSFG
ncbi:4-hydroxythreonine-4-phosphate dehydrogenase [Tritonibacter multivorans]|uniref:4-hydroxythreonine-4-phosphate dehydrogenase n=1 Tax=Tritonibacter multivorans TaxID=928856 RepID=A0A0P1GH05_9RHOB|nr:4-hydroxythreonine-4-phosphate dehydrogenase PdxA [Tritonibacter multivorans]MDA7420786.1 4-hydroxythreonine-4-phosphate dehydrogenase PdxA [Tritonibacter multivorans]CUH80936.1 4-hydroxythreonine-4-phosphate dehydrogenase [Tritonibacter multivorans]SFC86761.1 4-hydroxythreonine-4-phosphate dehydrogenase [Tritonibacter multivorans]